MRVAFVVLIQFVIFLLVFFVGSLFVHPFHLRTTLQSDSMHVRVFVWDGLLMMLLLYCLVLGLATIARRFRDAGGWSTLAFLLAGGAGLAMKFGFLTLDR